MPSSFAGAPIRFRKRAGALFAARAAHYSVRSDDGTLALNTLATGAPMAETTEFVDAYSGVRQFAVVPKRKVLNSKYDVVDSGGTLIGRLKHHWGESEASWSLQGPAGDTRASLVAPNSVLKTYLARAHGARGDAFAFVMGHAPFATLTHERRPRRLLRGLAKLAGGLVAGRDWVLRLEPENVAHLDPRVVIAAATMVQELTLTIEDVTNPHPGLGLRTQLARFRAIARL